MKKKFLTILITTICCFLLSSIIETLIFNFHSLTIGDEGKFISSVPYSSETTHDKTILNLKLDNATFINKLVINYETPQSTEYTIAYTYNGLYDNASSQTIQDRFDDAFSQSITNINATVQSAHIEYNSNTNLKITNIAIDNAFHFNIYRVLFTFLALLTIFSLFYFYKTGFTTDKLHIYFAVLCTLLGAMFIVAQPAATFYSWDDQIHFQRAIDWFGGNITYSNGEYNLSDANVLESTGKESTNSAEEKAMLENYLNTDIDHQYTKATGRIPSLDKISYLPMAIGYNLAKFIRLPFIACFQIGKLFNLLFYAILVAYAIKTLKTGKRLLAIIALFPSNIFLASEYSYDPAVFIGVTIFLVHVVNLIVDKKTQFNFKTCIIMIASIAYACFAKAIYAPFTLLLLFVPKDRFQSPKQAKKIKAGFIAITILLLTLAILPSLNGDTQSDPRGNNTSASDQMSLIINHPLDFASVMHDNEIVHFSNRLIGHSTVSNFAYAGSTRNESNIYFIFLILLLFVFFTDNKNNHLTKKQRSAIFASTLVIITFIWAALYISFSSVGSDTIDGVQNRYFLPLLFPLLLSIQPKNIINNIKPKLYNAIILTIPTILTIQLIFSFILLPYSF